MPTAASVTTLVDGPGKVTLMITGQGMGSISSQVIYAGTPTTTLRSIRYSQNIITVKGVTLRFSATIPVVLWNCATNRNISYFLDFSDVGGLKNYAVSPDGNIILSTSSFDSAEDSFMMIVELGK